MTASLFMVGACAPQATGGLELVETSGRDLGSVGLVKTYRLSNDSGVSVELTNIGASITSLKTPDSNGEIADIILGYDNPDDYLRRRSYFGVVVGRYANRIANGKFVLDDREFELDRNNGNNHLHGGITGFDKRIWAAELIRSEDFVGVQFGLTSPDGDQGYPGELDVAVAYKLNNESELHIEYAATTDASTIINLMQHSYFNLDGHHARSILDHELQIMAEKFTPVDVDLIPTGKLMSVLEMPLNFRSSKPIGRDIEQENEQLLRGRGFDHNWVLSESFNPGRVKLAVKLSSPASGRKLSVYTDQPGVQFYSGNFLDGSEIGKGGVAYEHRQGLCLETQHFPDSPNQAGFPSTVLRPGEQFTSKTIWAFGARP